VKISDRAAENEDIFFLEKEGTIRCLFAKNTRDAKKERKASCLCVGKGKNNAMKLPERGKKVKVEGKGEGGGGEGVAQHLLTTSRG